MNILIIVDMQNDFITGSLGSELAQNIVNNVVAFTNDFEGKIIFTRDTHDKDYLTTLEGKNLPVEHCIKGTNGWEICSQLQEISSKNTIIDKPAFGSIDLPKVVKDISNNEDLTITLVGLCTDICVISNAILLKAYFPQAIVKVIENCCAGVTVESHTNAINAMKMCQIEIEG